MPDSLVLSSSEVIASGVLTGATSYALLYLNAFVQWHRFQLGVEVKPRLSEGRKHLREYLQLIKRIKARAPVYVNDGTWLKQLGFDQDTSALKVLAKVESLIDKSKEAKLDNTLQHAVLEAFLKKAEHRQQVKLARSRLLADQEATNTAMQAATAPVSPQHPITKALRGAVPVKELATAPSQEDALRTLGLKYLAAKRPLTLQDVKSAYKAKKRAVRGSVTAKKVLEQAYAEVTRLLG